MAEFAKQIGRKGEGERERVATLLDRRKVDPAVNMQ